MSFILKARAINCSFRYYLNRATGVRKNFGSVALRTLKLCEGGNLRKVRPYFWTDHASRIRDGQWHKARELIWELLNQQTFEFRPLKAYQFRDAFLVDGSVYLGNAIRIELRSASTSNSVIRRLSIMPVAPQVEAPEAALVGGMAGSTWFGHWLMDELPLQMLASLFAPPIAQVRPEHRDEPGYRELLKLTPPKRVGTAMISRLTIIDEFGQNPNKARRYWQIREQLALRPKGADRVFLSRGSWGSARPLRNEKGLLDRFAAEGYAIVDISTTSLSELLGVLNGASLVVSVEGSHLTHALYAMADFGTMIILNPPERTLTTVAGIAPFCGLFAAMFICSPNEDGSFSADVNELLIFIDAAVDDSKARRGELNRLLDFLRQNTGTAAAWPNR
jgi:Glycosyltransferase 61